MKENPVFCVGDMPTQNGTISQIFGGANRRLSEQDGLVVNLCHSCHNEPPYGVHFNKETMERLHRYGQKMWEDRQVDNGMSRDEARKAFIRKYGKNYIYL